MNGRFAGTMTLLITDIEASAGKWEQDAPTMSLGSPAA